MFKSSLTVNGALLSLSSIFKLIFSQKKKNFFWNFLKDFSYILGNWSFLPQAEKALIFLLTFFLIFQDETCKAWKTNISNISLKMFSQHLTEKNPLYCMMIADEAVKQKTNCKQIEIFLVF